MQTVDQFFRGLIEKSADAFVSVGIAKISEQDRIISVFKPDGSAERFLCYDYLIVPLPDADYDRIESAREKIIAHQDSGK